MCMVAERWVGDSEQGSQAKQHGQGDGPWWDPLMREIWSSGAKQEAFQVENNNVTGCDVQRQGQPVRKGQLESRDAWAWGKHEFDMLKRHWRRGREHRQLSGIHWRHNGWISLGLKFHWPYLGCEKCKFAKCNFSTAVIFTSVWMISEIVWITAGFDGRKVRWGYLLPPYARLRQ